MNPNYDEMANPDNTYVDIPFGEGKLDLRLPEPKKQKTVKRKKTRVGEPVSDVMQNILLRLNTVPGSNLELPNLEDVQYNGSQEPVPSDFVVPQSGPFPIIVPQLPVRDRTTGGNLDSELGAAQRGLRWHWHNENSFMPPGSEWNKTVWQGADRESQLLNRGSAGNSGLMSPIAQVRLRGQWLSERNKAIQDYINGNWDDPERAYTEFRNAIGKIDEKLISLGEDPALLRPVPPVAGKRSTFTTQSGPIKLRSRWNYANNINNTIKEWIDSGKIYDKNFMGSPLAKNFLDATGETIVKFIKESSNTMADAEKKRLQILMLTDEGQTAVEQVIHDYQTALKGVMSSASAKKWSQNNKGKINEIIKALGFDPSKKPEDLGEQLAVLGGIIATSLSRNDELPLDVATDLEAIQEQYESYMERMMLAALVDPRTLSYSTKVLGDIISSQYNDQAYASSRGVADKLGTIEDLTDMIPKNAIPLSPLLKDKPKFVWPSLINKVGGRVNTNPESKGETSPRRPGKPAGKTNPDGSVDY